MTTWMRPAFRDDTVLFNEITTFEGDDPYNWHDVGLAQTEDGWHLVDESGCSCDGPGDHPEVRMGPLPLKELRDEIVAEFRSNKDTYRYYDNWTTPTLIAIDDLLASRKP